MIGHRPGRILDPPHLAGLPVDPIPPKQILVGAVLGRVVRRRTTTRLGKLGAFESTCASSPDDTVEGVLLFIPRFVLALLLCADRSDWQHSRDTHRRIQSFRMHLSESICSKAVPVLLSDDIWRE